MLQNHRELEKRIAGEFPGASCTWNQGRKHMRLVVEHGGRKAIVFCPVTPSDSRRGDLNTLAQVRRTLKNGAAQAG